MFLCCTSSRLLHVPGCSLLASVPPEEITPAENLNGLFCSGYEVCKECSPLRKMLQDEGDAIRTYCKENHFKYHLHNKYIAVQAPQSQWGIALAENTFGTTLYHKSTRPERRDGFLPAYHMQQVSAATLLPYFQYIAFHDGLKDSTQPTYRLQESKSCGSSHRRSRNPIPKRGASGTVVSWHMRRKS